MTLEGEPQHITNDLGSHDNDDKLEGQYCDPQAAHSIPNDQCALES